MIDCDWPWWIMFAAAMVSSYFREMRLRAERNDPRCTLFYTSGASGAACSCTHSGTRRTKCSSALYGALVELCNTII